MESDRLLHNDGEDEVIVINQELIKLNVLIIGESQLEFFSKQEMLVEGWVPIMLFWKAFILTEWTWNVKILRYNTNIPHSLTLVINEKGPLPQQNLAKQF